ncbi:uncharacterized protein SPPG_04222 [Spizellomyces punctatus DAOM BR117]|uniref:Centriolar and ciliogenesis-associated protein HYLS1 C-terminal domain-containing protein n=1 Tax=Spizellomyces punctatus (strain DAOM BR117) TaxID=645134 RepID=A0A0L0HI76_SPIPD|nr:uncharacterized protein SPPG_04222 [Spizellomyces punctatus DAOM BR117]KND01131.1 hypothetical protein SPPG_04222 [Spizellomyces punctatus DAOM BR117]|eukprot:XP_016609170.1 hypothetical protein SPPG_04222 [Spizellomyces punctatus DAOM BR117]
MNGVHASTFATAYLDSLDIPDATPLSNWSCSLSPTDDSTRHAVDTSHDLHISKDDVRAQLVTMGYEPDALPDKMLDEFIEELKRAYRTELGEFLEEDDEDDEDKDSLSTEPDETSRLERPYYPYVRPVDDKKGYWNEKASLQKVSRSPSPQKTPERKVREAQTTTPQRQIQRHDKPSDESTEYDTTQTTCSPATHQMNVIERLAALDLSNVRRTVSHQRQKEKSDTRHAPGEEEAVDDDLEDEISDDLYDSEEYALRDSTNFSSFESEYYERPRYRTGFIRAQPQQRPRKHDPVSRFHQHQAEWQRDVFLRRLGNPGAQRPVAVVGSTKVSRPMSGGLASQRPRHNLAALRPTYVVPTTKKRSDVVWDVRNRLALKSQTL